MSVVLVKALRSGECGHLQSVEKVVTEQHTGEFHLKTFGLTDEYLILSDAKPKKILKVIPLSNICDIKIIADRNMIIKGGKHSHICQHIQIIYTTADTDPLVSKLNNYLESSNQNYVTLKKQKSKSTTILNKSPSSKESVAEDSSSISSTSNNWELRRIYIQNQNVHLSNKSSGRDNTGLMINEYDLSYEIIKKYSPHVSSRINRLDVAESNNNSGSSSPFTCEGSSDSEDSFLSGGNEFQRNHSSSNFLKPNTIPRRAKSVLGVYSVKEHTKSEFTTRRPPESRHSDIFQSQKNIKQTEPKERTKRSIVGSRGIRDKSGTSLNNEQRSSWIPLDDKPHEINEGTVRQPSGQNIISAEFSDGSNSIDRPSSVDISQIETLRKRLFGGLFSSSRTSSRLTSFTRISSDPVLHNANGSNESTNESESSNASKSSQSEVKIDNVYLYKSKSKFLNELYLWWTRHLMIQDTASETCSIGTESYRSFSTNWKIQDAEKVYQKVTDAWSPFRRSFWKIRSSRGISSALQRLKALHKDLLRYQHLKRLIWKNWDVILNIMGILYSTEILMEARGSTCKDFEDLSDVLCLMTVGMEVFRLLYSALSTEVLTQEPMNSASGSYTFSSTDGTTLFNLPLNFGQLTQMIVRVTLKCLMVPSAGTPESDKIKRLVTSSHHFTNGAWLSQPNSQVIKLVVISFNTSVSLLQEILTIEYFSAKDQERLEFMSTLQTHSLDTYVSMSITQVVNLLRCDAPDLRPQKALLFSHFFVIRILLEKCENLKSFVRDNYVDDFKYFIHDRNVKRVVPEKHPLLPKLLEYSRHLRQEIVNS